MGNKINILDLELNAVKGGTKTEICVNEPFREMSIEELGIQYIEVEQELLDALSSAVNRYSKQLNCLVKEREKETDDEQA